MSLQIPIPCSFKIGFITDKAIIAEDLDVSGQRLLARAVLPKMCVENLAIDGDMAQAYVDKWVLMQRVQEAKEESSEQAHIDELFEM